MAAFRIGASLLWTWSAEGQRPDRFGRAGAAPGRVGTGVIRYAPRA